MGFIPDNEIPAVLSETSRKRYTEKKNSIVQQFIKGPLPMPWIEEAAKLPGKSLAVSMLLWYKGGMNGLKDIKLTSIMLKRFGIGRKASYRALSSLEASKLISVMRRSGKSPIITIQSQTMKG